MRSRFPDVEILFKWERLVLRGSFPVEDEKGVPFASYRLEIPFPKEYPDWVPGAYMREAGVPLVANRHIFASGRACFCLPHEVLTYAGSPVVFERFYTGLLKPWLIGQAFYDANDQWPPWQTRSHDEQGVLEWLREMTGIKAPDVLWRFLAALVREHPLKGHEWCPCGSGKRLRQCHAAQCAHWREQLPPQSRQLYRDWLAKHR